MGTTNAPTQLVKRTPEEENVLAISRLLGTEKVQNRLSSALRDSGVKSERMLSVAMTVMRSDYKLRNADPISFIDALLKCAIMGLMPDGVSGQAYLVPFQSGDLTKKAGHPVFEVQAMIGYRGFVQKAYKSKMVKSVVAQNVYENDIFELNMSTGEPPVHKFDIKQPSRGAYIASYAVVKLETGEHLVEVMLKSDIEKIRERSKAKASGPWVTDFEEMARKTVLRRLAKWIPDEAMQRLAAVDEDNDLGLNTIQIDEDGSLISVPRQESAESANSTAEKASSNANSDLKDRLNKATKGNGTVVDAETTPVAQAQPKTEAPKADAPKADEPKPETAKPSTGPVAPEFAIDSETREEWVRGTVTKVFKAEKKGTSHSRNLMMGDIRLSTFHGSLFDAMDAALGKVMVAHIIRKPGTKGDFLNIEKIESIDDVKYFEGKPIPPITAEHEVGPEDAKPPEESKQKSDMNGEFFDK